MGNFYFTGRHCFGKAPNFMLQNAARRNLKSGHNLALNQLLLFHEFFNLYRNIAIMDVKALDKALQEILKKREELAKLDYNNPKYDDLEEQLHDMEDDFQEKYGEYLEEALQDIHDDICPDNDVLMPIAYLGKGVPVEAEKHPDVDTKLILATNPPRIVLSLGKEKQEVVWTAK
jgi:hypothetical protein